LKRRCTLVRRAGGHFLSSKAEVRYDLRFRGPVTAGIGEFLFPARQTFFRHFRSPLQ
jgi:hypothetical protein